MTDRKDTAKPGKTPAGQPAAGAKAAAPAAAAKKK